MTRYRQLEFGIPNDTVVEKLTYILLTQQAFLNLLLTRFSSIFMSTT